MSGPIVTTQPAAAIATDRATLHGLVNPGGKQTHWWFDYGRASTGWDELEWEERTNLETDPFATGGSWVPENLGIFDTVVLGEGGHPAPTEEMKALGLTTAFHCGETLAGSARINSVKNLVSGRTYTWSRWVYQVSGDTRLSVWNQVTNESAGNSEGLLVTGDWVREHVTFTATHTGNFQFRDRRHSASPEWYVTGILVEEASELRPYHPTAPQIESGEATQNVDSAWVLAPLTTSPILASDDFDRPDENPVSDDGKWTGVIRSADNPMQVVDGQLARTDGTSSAAHEASFADGEVEIKIATAFFNNYLYLRTTKIGEAGVDGYRMGVLNGSWVIQVVTSGVTNGANIGDSHIHQVSSGDSVRFRAVGETLEAWHKPAAGDWTKLFERNHSAYSEGRVGVLTTSAVTRFESFRVREPRDTVSGAEDVAVDEEVTELEPETSYDFRLVADNGVAP